MKALIFVTLFIAGCAVMEGRDPASAGHAFQCKSENGQYAWTAADTHEMPIGKCTGASASGCTVASDENGYAVTCTAATAGKYVSAE
jgi:hypothetical protein